MALRHISLRDFVIVRTLDLDLSQGFTVLTGETGAGKSILLDALQFALGARAETTWIREGSTRAEVAAEFDATPACEAWLEHAGFDPQGSVLVRRVVDSQGKSRGWINGSTATATQLRAVGDLLLDIHGQHAWQSLTRNETVRDLLDGYAAVDRRPLANHWEEWRRARRALEMASTEQAQLHERREQLTWQLSELDRLAPGPDEWEPLNADHERLLHAQSLIDAASRVIEQLQDDDRGALASLARARALLADQEPHEPTFAEWTAVLASSLAQAEDVAHSLQTYLRRTDLDPQRLEKLDERLSAWMTLSRRFRVQPAELPALHARWQQELRALDAAGDLATLRRQEALARSAFEQEASAVSARRQQAAPALARAVTEVMQQLGMVGSRLDVRLEPLAQPAAHGLEDIQFLVAGHPGSTPRPVGKVASGGELSRIALAISVITSELGVAPTLIFDEVDSGIGGAVAETVGQLMRRLGQDRQVLAVTHLPQVAACAHHHLQVSKRRLGCTTVSEVASVGGEARVAEIARMLGGERISETTRAHARELIAPHGADLAGDLG